MLDVFQVCADGEYSRDGDFRGRARLLTSESGSYEFETVHPVPYETPKGSNRWRSPHIHFVVGYPGYETLATELQFAGDPKADVDFNGRPESLVKTVQEVENHGQVCESCTFDIVLAPKNPRRSRL